MCGGGDSGKGVARRGITTRGPSASRWSAPGSPVAMSSPQSSKKLRLALALAVPIRGFSAVSQINIADSIGAELLLFHCSCSGHQNVLGRYHEQRYLREGYSLL